MTRYDFITSDEYITATTECVIVSGRPIGKMRGEVNDFVIGLRKELLEYAQSLLSEKWIGVEERLPEEGQIVDIWEMPRTQILERALSLKGTDYGNQYYDATYYSGWRSTNYKFTIEHDDEGPINCFIKCGSERYFTIPNGGHQYKKLCVENGEVAYWMPLPKTPSPPTK